MAPTTRRGPKFRATPRANLMPVRQRAELLHERRRRQVFASVALSAGVAVGLSFLGMWSVGLAQARLSAAETRTEELNSKFAEHSELHHTRQEIDMISNQIAMLDAGQAEYMSVFDLTAGSLPADSFIREFRAAPLVNTGETATMCTGGPFSVTVMAQLPSVAASSTYLRSLDALDATVCVEATAIDGGTSDEFVITTVHMVMNESIAGTRAEEETP